MVNAELKEKLYNDYNVYYCDVNHAWMRTYGKWNRKDYELGKVTELITGDNILSDGKCYVNYQEYMIEGSICICGCPMCEKLYRLTHIDTGTDFMVGSKCITKAGFDNFINDVRCGQSNGFCKICEHPLIFRGERKNTKKEWNGFCKKCCKVKKIILDIKYHDKDKYKKYGTRWDTNLKVWYWKGYNYDFPPQLEKLKKST